MTVISLISCNLVLFSFAAISHTENNSHSALAPICNVLKNTNCSSTSQSSNTNKTSTAANPQLAPITIETDKNSYGFGDYVETSGSVSKVVEGKTVRIDVYTPDGRVVPTFNESLINESLSNVRVKPTEDGSFFFKFQIPSPIIVYASDRGIYTISATYVGNTAEAKFTVR